MRIATIVLVLAALGAADAGAQVGLKSCPLLADADAAPVLGAGTQFYSARQSPTSTFCSWGGGKDRTLTLNTGSLPAANVAEYRKIAEAMRQADKGTLENGLGEYAYSTLSAGESEITAAKGKLTLTLTLKGPGLGAGDLVKLRAAAGKALAKMP